jgi:glutamate transport system ATP-binding protein
VLRDIDTTVGRGEVVVVVGPSGSGKSTLCRVINRLEPIDSGTITVDGRPLPVEGRELAQLRADIGMVFQSFNLFSHKTILQNVMLGPITVRRRPKAEAQQRALRLLERVGIADQAGKLPGQLSGGQQQRVAIARALVGDRRLVLADEPTGALDSQTGESVLKLLRARVDAGAAGVLVTHEARHAGWADRVVFLRDGVIVDTTGPLDSADDLLTSGGAAR